MIIQISEASYTSNHVKINSDIRKVFTTSAAFGILRQQLVKNIGMKRLKTFCTISAGKWVRMMRKN